MSTMLLHNSPSHVKRARILPMDVARAHLNKPQLKSSEGCCELNTVLGDVLTRYSRSFTNKFVSPISDGALVVRVSDHVLERVIGLIFEGMWSAGLWRDGEYACISPVICTCLDGFGAVLELTDTTASLSPALLAQLSHPDVIRSQDLPGKELLIARDLIKRHGGKLYARSPIWEKTGTSIRLFLPLATKTIR